MIGDKGTRIPDLAEPISAWRCWKLAEVGDIPRLVSPASGTTWPPLIPWGSEVVRDPDRTFVTARCIPGFGGLDEDHDSPSHPRNLKGHHGAGCGLYGYKRIEDLAWDWALPGMTAWKTWTGKDRLVWGKVLLWGRVYEHRRGYRAEFARVDSLVAIDGLPDVGVTREKLAEVAAFYGVGLDILSASTLGDIETARKERLAGYEETLQTYTSVIAASVVAFDKVMKKAKAAVDAFVTKFNESRSQDG